MIVKIALDNGGDCLVNFTHVKYTEPRSNGGTTIHMTSNKSEKCMINTPETLDALLEKLGTKLPKPSRSKAKKEV